MHLTRRSELLRKRLFVPFFLCCWSALSRDSCFDHGVWPVPCLDPCPFFFCSASLSLCCFVIRAQIEKRSQVALVSAEPVQELSFCQPIRKSAALFEPFIVILFGVVLLSWNIAPSPLGKLCQEQVCVSAL